MASRGTTKFNSNKQEKKVAREIGGKSVIASGSLWGSKGDVRSNQFLIECKTTEKDYYSLSTKVWEKIESEAARDGLRIPVMCVDLLDGNYRKAVFKLRDLHYGIHDLAIPLRAVTTTRKSFRIKCSDPPTEVSLESVRVPDIRFENGTPLSLVVVPWDWFLEFTSDM